MNCLHIINKGGIDASTVKSCLACIQPDDTLLLIEEGVYLYPKIKNTRPSQTVVVLKNDAEARGVLIDQVANIIDYSQFVALTCQHKNSVSW